MEPAIKIKNLSKQYRLGRVGTGTLSHDLNRWWHIIRKKEDPYLKIGEINDRTKKGNSEFIWALKGINIEVEQGEVLGIIGKNGAGKSTLLKILSKVTGPTTGSITYAGHISSLLEVGTGFHPDLTGRENIYLNGAILGMNKKEIYKKFDEIVDFSGCERYIDTPLKRYSSGMIIRLGFSVAAFLEPEILIVDEVFAVGDAEFQKKAILKIKEITSETGRTVLFVSHNMSAIKHLCHKAVLLKQGSISLYGNSNDVIDKYLNSISIHKKKVRRFLHSNDGKIILKMPFWINDAGEEVKFFSVGEQIILRFEFEFLVPFKKINIGINLYRKDRIRLFTSFLSEDISFNKPLLYHGKVVLDSNFDITTLAPDLYSVSFGIKNELEELICHSENELMLEIGSVQLKNPITSILYHTTKWRSRL